MVIAAIATLAAMLMPVLAEARGKARQTMCSGNTRQLALAVLMYATDSDDVLPPVAYPMGQGASSVALWPDVLLPYVKSAAVRKCPDDSATALNSYGLNELGFSDLTDPAALARPAVPLAAFRTPAETVMLGDLGTENDLRTVRPGAYKMVPPSYPLNDAADARPAARHFQRVNLAMMDGHEKPLSLTAFYLNQSPPDRWFLP